MIKNREDDTKVKKSVISSGGMALPEGIQFVFIEMTVQRTPLERNLKKL